MKLALLCAPVALLLASIFAHGDVIAKNGNFLWIETDLVDPANPDLKVLRAYNSKSPFVGGFGLGWAYPWGGYVDSPSTVHDWGGGQTVTGVVFSNEGALRVRTASDGSRQLFDTSGLLVELRGPHDYKIARNADGLLESVTDEQGHRLGFKWGAPGRVIEISGAGGVVDYRYDDAGLLSYVKQADGKELRYTYDGAGRGNLIRIEFPDGSTYEVDYYDRALNENVRQVKTREGQVTRYNYTWDKANPGFSHVELIEAPGRGQPETHKTLDFPSPENGARPSWGSAKPEVARGVPPMSAAPSSAAPVMPGASPRSPLPFVLALAGTAAAALTMFLWRKKRD